MNSEQMKKFCESGSVAWERDCEMMNLRDAIPDELLRLAREIYFAGYFSGRIDELIDATGDDRWEPTDTNN